MNNFLAKSSLVCYDDWGFCLDGPDETLGTFFHPHPFEPSPSQALHDILHPLRLQAGWAQYKRVKVFMCGVAPAVAAADEGAEEFAQALLALSGEVYESNSGDQISNSTGGASADDGRFYCPFPGCKRSFAELWRLKVHYRAPPDVRGSGKERGHGMRLDRCPKCNEVLKVGGHHVRCSAREAARQLAKKPRRSTAAEIIRPQHGGKPSHQFAEASAHHHHQQQQEPQQSMQREHQTCPDNACLWQQPQPQVVSWQQQQQQPELFTEDQHEVQPGSTHLLRLQQLLARVDQHLGYYDTDPAAQDETNMHKASVMQAGTALPDTHDAQSQHCDTLLPLHVSMAVPSDSTAYLQDQHSQHRWSPMQQQWQQPVEQQQALAALSQQQQEPFSVQGAQQLQLDAVDQLQQREQSAAELNTTSSTHAADSALQQALDAVGAVLQQALCELAAEYASSSVDRTLSHPLVAAMGDEPHLLALLKEAYGRV